MQSNFIEIALRHGCSPVNLLNVFRTPLSRNTSGWLLLPICLQGVFPHVFFCGFCEISKNTFFTDTSGGCFRNLGNKSQQLKNIKLFGSPFAGESENQQRLQANVSNLKVTGRFTLPGLLIML